MTSKSASIGQISILFSKSSPSSPPPPNLPPPHSLPRYPSSPSSSASHPPNAHPPIYSYHHIPTPTTLLLYNFLLIIFPPF